MRRTVSSEFDIVGIGDKKIFDGEQLLRADKRDDALMGGGFELGPARLLLDANASLAAGGNEALDKYHGGARGPPGRGRSDGARL